MRILCTGSASLLSAALVFFAPGLTFAQAPVEEAAWTVTLENDVFFGSDRYYTNAVQYEWTEGKPHSPSDLSSQSVWERACDYLGCAGHAMLTRHHKLGQLMYTPENIEEAAPQPFDRPWAGLLYYAQHRVFLSPDGGSTTKLTGQIGVIGPASLSKDAQTLVHRIIDSPKPLGWANQSGSEIVGLVMVERKAGLDALSGDLTGDWKVRTTRNWRAAAGTLMTFAGAGLEVTIGTGLADFVSDAGNVDIKGRRAIQPPVLMNASPSLDAAVATPASNRRTGNCLFGWAECSLTAGLEARWMIHNVFLDGPVFADGPSVASKRLVADASLAFQLVFPRSATASEGPWIVKFKATRRTSEFRGSRPHTFGALTVGRLFN